MKRYIASLLFWGFATLAVAQVADTTVYFSAEVPPRFPGCENLDTTAVVRQKCSEESLLNFIYSNVQYPLEARMNDVEGTVVVRFIIEKDGTISNLEVVRDIGSGCAEEALRVVGAMNEIGVRWTPGLKDGEPVRVQFNLPVKFKLEEPLPYTIVGQDTIYSVVDQDARFISETDSISAWIVKKVKVPAEYQDTCLIGDLEISLLVKPNGRAQVLDVSDYNNLGFDLQFEFIAAANASSGMWEPAVYEGKKVTSIINVPVLYQTMDPSCYQLIRSFERAKQLSEEGLMLYNQGEVESGLAKMSEAIDLFPDHANFRYVRGQAYLNEELFDEACVDLRHVQKILPLSAANGLVDLICK
ncbi:MAG: TonB family protein [Bacteroidetes bacterium]|nr:TonB family protein [Bacteroidota bacterium]